jgi:hypothetical protein
MARSKSPRRKVGRPKGSKNRSISRRRQVSKKSPRRSKKSPKKKSATLRYKRYMSPRRSFFKNKTFIFSGVRDVNLEDYIYMNGGRVSTGIVNSDVLIVKQLGKLTAKEMAAHKLNIPIMTIFEARRRR